MTRQARASRAAVLLAAATAMLFFGFARVSAEEPVPGSQTAHKLAVSKKQVGYWLFVPKSYEKKKAWPLLLFLHGAGERGDNIQAVKAWGPPRLAARDQEFPFVVVSPQCPKGAGWNPEQLKALVEHVAGSHKIDRSRMYCTGLSMGGYGTWSIVAKYPKLFAAAVTCPREWYHSPSCDLHSVTGHENSLWIRWVRCWNLLHLPVGGFFWSYGVWSVETSAYMPNCMPVG